MFVYWNHENTDDLFQIRKGQKIGYIHLCRTQYNCGFVFGHGERAVCDNSNVPVIAYQRHSAL